MILRRRTSRTLSFRHSLALNLLVVTCLLGGALMATTYLGSERASMALARALMVRTAAQTESELRRFFEPVPACLGVIQAWVAAGTLDPEDPDQVNSLLAPVVRNTPQVSSLLLADERGREHMLLRTPDGWMSRQSRLDQWGEEKRFMTWTDSHPEPVIEERPLDYDPRLRPWFEDAIAPGVGAASAELGPLHWTAPYTFFTTKDPGMTASASFTTPDGVRRVVGLDVLLGDISAFTRRIRVSEGGMLFVLTDTAQVIGLPDDPRFATEAQRKAAYLKRPEELGMQVAADAAARFYSAPEGESAVRFDSGGEPWWCEAHPFRLGEDGATLWVGVVVPERDLLGGLHHLRMWIMILTAVVLLLGTARAVVLARSYSKPLEALVERNDRIARGDLEEGRAVVTSITELRELATAQERMREALSSLMKLERDLQLARQIQQNTFPRDLPQLSGFEIAAWSEPADETGGDTYDVIGLLSRLEGPVLLSETKADRAVLLMADATGHGIGPALSVTQIRAMLRLAVRTGLDLVPFVRHLNEQLCADLHSGRFITAWLAEIDTNGHTLRSISAGQGPLLHYHAARGTCEIRDADAPPFGILADIAYHVPDTLELDQGDIYAVLSDGIYESASPSGELFGAERVAELIVAGAAMSPATIIESICAAVEKFTHGAPAADDRTGIVLKRS